MEVTRGVDTHPYVTAWRTRDLAGKGAALATDVVLDPPLLKTPFRG
jgi:hypothetical protein